MGVGEEGPLVARGGVSEGTAVPTSTGGADGTDRQRHRRQQQPDFLKLLLPLMIALGVFGVSTGAARYLFPRKKIQRQQPLAWFETKGDRLGVVREGTGYLTGECASSTKVVVQGFDLTSYFSLDVGATPVAGVAEHESKYNGYTFWFASEENKAQFEVKEGA